MRNKKLLGALLAVTTLATFGLAGCGDSGSNGAASKEDDKTITVAASPTPHAEILNKAVKPLVEKLKEALKDSVEDVRVTTRLVDSPACLVVKDAGMSLQFERLMRQAGQAVPATKPVLEINPEHALVKKLEGNPHFDDLAHILFDQALLAEGGLPDNPAAYVRRVNALLA